MKWNGEEISYNVKDYVLDKLDEYAESIKAGGEPTEEDECLFKFRNYYRAEEPKPTPEQGNEKIRKILKEKGFSQDGIDGLEALMQHIWERMA